MERSSENLAGTVRISPPTPVIREQQAGMIAALSVQPGRASTAAVQSNLISPATGQSTRNTRRRNRSWSSSLFRTGLMLLFRNQGVCNIREGFVHKVRDTNLAGFCLKGKLSMLEVLHQQSNVRGPRARCAHQDQHRFKGYDVVLQLLDVIQSVPGAGCVRRDQPGVKDYDVAPQRIDITNVAVLDPG